MQEELYFIESGQKRRAEKTICKNCNCEFLRRKNKSSRQFCSINCKNKGKKTSLEVKCYSCKTKFHKTKFRIHKSTNGLHFCSRKCKDFAQSLKGGCKEIQPSHYGTSEGRSEARKEIDNIINPHCIDCLESRRYLLFLHHKDGNHNNNPLDGSNWEVVCGNCHIKRHLKWEKNEWRYYTKVLTPRELIKEL